MVRGPDESTNRLPGDEQAGDAAQVPEIAAAFDRPPLDDEMLSMIADETFLMYDASEAVDGKG